MELRAIELAVERGLDGSIVDDLLQRNGSPRFARILFWIIEKLVVQFRGNFFNAWLKIAGKRSKEISTPSWDEVIAMRDRSFPIVALKYNFVEKSSSSSIEYHDSENEELSADKYVCPYLHETVKRNILTMTS
ncbi:MAG: hypothetical protein ACE3K2_12190 [Paenibacillus sp.]|uniref:hypothetical protein n=1 Tax=Paenibacillus sp. TaxID=58172 RepID=UPI003B81FE5D